MASESLLSPSRMMVPTFPGWAASVEAGCWAQAQLGKVDATLLASSACVFSVTLRLSLARSLSRALLRFPLSLLPCLPFPS